MSLDRAPVPRRRVVVGVAGLLLTMASGGCGSAPAPTVAPTPSASPVAPGPGARVLIFGDSYTEGWGATPKTQGYAYRVGKALQWDVVVDGVGGSGYLATGTRNEGRYLTRLHKAPAGPFDLVVLQGGSNDEALPASKLRPAVAATVAELYQRYPGARVVMMGPVAIHGGRPPLRDAVNGLLRDYASSREVPFLDPMGEQWFARGEGPVMVNPANGHPNNVGYARIAERFVAEMRQT